MLINAADEDGIRRELKGLNKGILVDRLVSQERSIRQLQNQSEKDWEIFQKRTEELERALTRARGKAKNYAKELRLLAESCQTDSEARQVVTRAKREVVCTEERVAELAEAHRFAHYDDGTNQGAQSKISLDNYEGQWRESP